MSMAFESLFKCNQKANNQTNDIVVVLNQWTITLQSTMMNKVNNQTR